MVKCIELTQRVKDICAKNHSSHCNRCQLKSVCFAKSGTDIESLNKYVEDINNRADVVVIPFLALR